MTAASYWKNALIRAARTFIQGFLGGFRGGRPVPNPIYLALGAIQQKIRCV